MHHAIVDALSDADLVTIGAACADMKLVTGGSGIALRLPETFLRSGKLNTDRIADQFPNVPGPGAVLSGSCSEATLAKVAAMQANRPSFQINPLALVGGADQAAEALAWALKLLPDGLPLIYASAAADEVRAAQDKLGREEAGALVEEAMAQIAKGLVANDVHCLVVAGSETSGAVVQALGISGIRIGPPIDPGVPWTTTLRQPELNQPKLALALKSRNFGAQDFSSRPWIAPHE